MRRILPLLMISLVLLCGCADKGEEGFNQLAQSIGEAQSVSFTAEVTAEYADKTAQFTLKLDKSSDAITVEVLKPESVKGIKARVIDGTAQLEYDGAILDIGELNDEGLSPMSALPVLLDAMQNGHIDIVWTDGDCTAARIIPSDDISITLWLDGELKPTNAEISCEEKTAVFVNIQNWEVSKNE